MKRSITLIAVSLLYSSHCFALFCPTNFNQMNIGDTIKQVEAQCGKPTSEKKSKSEANVPQEWTYYEQMPLNLGQGLSGPNTNVGTVKLTFSFVDNKVANMTNNGIGVGASTFCRNINLQIGSTTQDVEKACGKPPMVVKTNIPDTAGDIGTATEITEWKYAGPPPVTLIFENGVLKERK